MIVVELDEMVAEGYYIPGKGVTEKLKIKAKPPGMMLLLMLLVGVMMIVMLKVML